MSQRRLIVWSSAMQALNDGHAAALVRRIERLWKRIDEGGSSSLRPRTGLDSCGRQEVGHGAR